MSDFYVLVLMGLIFKLYTTFENEEKKVLCFIVCFFSVLFLLLFQIWVLHNIVGGRGHIYARKLY